VASLAGLGRLGVDFGAFPNLVGAAADDRVAVLQGTKDFDQVADSCPATDVHPFRHAVLYTDDEGSFSRRDDGGGWNEQRWLRPSDGLASGAVGHAFGALAASLVGISEYYLHGAGLGQFKMGALSFEVLLGSLTTTDGYADRSDQRLQALAGSLRWTPTSDVHVSASTTISFDSTSSYYGTPLINGAIDRRTRYINYNMRDNLARSHTSPLVSASATNFTSGLVVMDSSSAVSAITFQLSGANLGGGGLVTRYSVNYFLTDLWAV